MRLYHCTDPETIAVIIREGFRDGEGHYLTRNTYRGVWLSDTPDPMGAGFEQGLTLDIPETVVARWEWVEEGKGYREFLIPATLVNSYGPPQVVDVW
jgi:hypothetical protein